MVFKYLIESQKFFKPDLCKSLFEYNKIFKTFSQIFMITKKILWKVIGVIDRKIMVTDWL